MATLPVRPALEQVKKQAKELLHSHKSGDPQSCEILKRLKRFSDTSDAEILKTPIALHEAQYAIALLYGFDSWAKMKKAIDQKRIGFAKNSNPVVEVLRSLPKGESVLAVDIGSGTVKVAEFDNPLDGSFSLLSFAVKSYGGLDGKTDMGKALGDALRDMRSKSPCKGSKCLVSIPSTVMFMRYVSLTIDENAKDKLASLIASKVSEERQAISRAIGESVSDHYVAMSPDNKECKILVAAVRKQWLRQVVKTIQRVGLDPIMIYPAQLAFYNGAVANKIGQDRCEMILNIGKESSTLCFCDKENYYLRSWPLGGDAISAEIARALGVPFDEAEELKREHAAFSMVETEVNANSEKAPAIMKIIREVMTREHEEIKRAIGVFTAQEKGNAPTSLYLAGGSTLFTHMTRFFSEKLGVPVQYLNCFQKITLSQSVNRDELSEVAHLFAELIGLELSPTRLCPVVLSLKHI